MPTNTVRNFSKRGDAIPVPNLVDVQQTAYGRFLQHETKTEERDPTVGLECLLREIFPVDSYDGGVRLEYRHYRLEEPRYTPDECRELKLTFGMPFRIGLRLTRKDSPAVIEEEVYLGDMPVMMGGGEYIINGSERVIVNQLHRSPGVDFSIAGREGERPLHSARVIPERGSWIEMEVTKKDTLLMRIDQSNRIPVTTFLRGLATVELAPAKATADHWVAEPVLNPADGSVLVKAGTKLGEEGLKRIRENKVKSIVAMPLGVDQSEGGTTKELIRLFYTLEKAKVSALTADHVVVEPIVDTTTGEELVAVGQRIGDQLEKIMASSLKQVEVLAAGQDLLILNTILEEKQVLLPENVRVTEHEMALLALYARLRPGNPPDVKKARQLFAEKFYDLERYRLGKVGRFRLNRKFEKDERYKAVPETVHHLRSEDFLAAIRYLLDLRAGRAEATLDDIDHLGNRRLRTLDELASEEVRKGFLKLRRTMQEKMSTKDPAELAKIADLVNPKTISSAIENFFGRGELSQVVDQTNPLSQLTHERRLSALGPGGLNRKRAGFEVRDVHISHYGRVCPIETPEGANIGLICSLGLYSRIDEYGFLQTPYRQLKDGKAAGKPVYLRADEEMRHTFGTTEALDTDGRLVDGQVLARVQGEMGQVHSSKLDFVDISPKQIVGVSAALIPFLEHDDANRALMGSNMQRQAVPLLRVDPPCVATGLEREIASNSGMIVKAKRAGVVTYVDALRIVVDNADEYELRKFRGLNEKTCQNQRPIVALGQKVAAGQIIADGAATLQGELAIGKNVLVAFNTFDGYNFEDAIVISERLVQEDVFTSIHIEAFDVEVRETKIGKEEFTADIPNVSEKQLASLDETGVIRIGARVKPGDILVGKVAPKSKSELTPEEKLLHAIFGRAGEDVKNESLIVPAGTEGVVIGARKFSRRTHLSDDQKKSIGNEMRAFEREMDTRIVALFREFVAAVNDATGAAMVDPGTRQKVAQSENIDVVVEQVADFTTDWVKGSKDAKADGLKLYSQFWPRIEALRKEKARRLEHMKRGDELPAGVLEKVVVYLATKRPLSVGDKMAGRHGNKGVIARIVPVEDMPFLEDGTPVDVLLNPLGVPSRMNIGQILEVTLGWACRVLGTQAVTPVFDGATENEIHAMLKEANAYASKRMKETKGAHGDREILAQMPAGGKVQLFDGRTGDPFDQKTTVGCMYILKLHHLVDDKIHARATGPYSLITQQPLGGKARAGGQRFGEMEVWALEAYGAAYVLQELLTVKSDDVEGRTKIYESMVKGTHTLQAGMPMAFDVLTNEIKGLGLHITLEKSDSEGISLI